MNVTFACPFCKIHIKADDDMRGRMYDCPSCGRNIVVPLENTCQPPPVATKIAKKRVLMKILTGTGWVLRSIAKIIGAISMAVGYLLLTAFILIVIGLSFLYGGPIVGIIVVILLLILSALYEISKKMGQNKG